MYMQVRHVIAPNLLFTIPHHPARPISKDLVFSEIPVSVATVTSQINAVIVVFAEVTISLDRCLSLVARTHYDGSNGV